MHWLVQTASCISNGMSHEGEKTERSSGEGTDGVAAVIKDKQSKPRKKYHLALAVDQSSPLVK